MSTTAMWLLRLCNHYHPIQQYTALKRTFHRKELALVALAMMGLVAPQLPCAVLRHTAGLVCHQASTRVSVKTSSLMVKCCVQHY